MRDFTNVFKINKDNLEVINKGKCKIIVTKFKSIKSIKIWIDYLKIVNGYILPIFKIDEVYNIDEVLEDTFDCIICILFENTKSYQFYLTNNFKNMV